MRAVLVVTALCALAVAGCGGGSPEEAPAPEAAPPAGTVEAPADPSRPPAPRIVGTSLSGERIALADFRGKPVLVNVWSSW